MIASVILIMEHFGFPAMFLMNIVENLGIPFPTEAAYIAGQTMVNTGKASYISVFTVLLAGHMVGALISYYLGTLAGQKIEASQTGLTGVQKKLIGWYDKYGAVTVFGTRLLGYVRPWSSYVAGIAKVRLAPFIIYTLLGSAIFNVITLALTDSVVYVWREYEAMRLVIGLSLSVGFIYLLSKALIKYLKKRS